MVKKYVIGVDFGTDSCRAVVVDAANGKELSVAVGYYARWREGRYCDPTLNQYRQHPLDHIEALTLAVTEAMGQLPKQAKQAVVGMSFDMTSSTPCLVDKQGVPLALRDEFKENPNAMFVLWKDHTAHKEADKINTLAKEWKTDYTSYSGGDYSPEWVWAKVAHVLDTDVAVRSAAYSWIEHTDWIPALITGVVKPELVKRSRCAAGHKAMWHESWGGLPSEEFLVAVSPNLRNFRARLYDETYTGDTKVGNMTQEWADKLGLTTEVMVGVGAIDCHVGAVGAEVKPGTFVKVIGTSTCDIMSVTREEIGDKLIAGICGQVDGSVVPNMVGLEAGQPAFGDYYAWYKRLMRWSTDNIVSQTKLLDKQTREALIKEIDENILSELTKAAEKISVSDSSVLATDWINGRRTPDIDLHKKATITNLSLSSTAPLIFRAIVEATAYGSRAIMERFVEYGIEIKEVVGIGGISFKSPFVMQTLADVMNKPIRVARSEQTPALGAAMFAAVVAGVYDSVEQAQQAMGQGVLTEYRPDAVRAQKYDELYEQYKKFV